MKYLFVIIWIAGFTTAGLASAEPVKVIQTFNSDRIVDYTLVHTEADKETKLFYTMDKSSKQAIIKYDASSSYTLFEALSPILQKLISKAKTIDGAAIDTFMTFEYLKCDDIVRDAALAFHDSQPWRHYLGESKKRYVQPPYQFIKQRLVEKEVFKDVRALFRQLGYRIQLSSFEKLAVRKAGDFVFYHELKPWGIRPEDQIPVPLMLYFQVSPIEQKQ